MGLTRRRGDAEGEAGEEGEKADGITGSVWHRFVSRRRRWVGDAVPCITGRGSAHEGQRQRR